MRKLAVIVVIVGVIGLAGCDFQAIIDDLLGGGTPGGGSGIGGVTFTQVIVEYEFGIEVMRQPTPQDVAVLEPWSLFASLGSIGPLVFDTATNTYTVSTPIGSDPYVLFSITLDSAGSIITYLDAYRRMSHGYGGWERIDRIIAEDIPYDRVEGLSTFYRIDASNLGWAGLLFTDYRDWSKTAHTEQNPMYWVVDPSNMQGYFNADPDRYIEIEFRQ